MEKKQSVIRIKPIGGVRTQTSENKLQAGEVISQILLAKDLATSLDGLDGFSHIYIIFWMHKIPPTKLVGRRKIYPWGELKMPLVGVFATRSPVRPNPIGLTLVELLERRGNILKVKGLDALDGTLVLDIKPFDFWDAEKFRKAKVPDWWMKGKTERWKQWRQLLKTT
ncbi:MAG: tRNA (N6-threonylcarbamoyladenosine(37)-N6)-methyltransferase TrmO [Candidatus Bathyarchaeota archaeon]